MPPQRPFPALQKPVMTIKEAQDRAEYAGAAKAQWARCKIQGTVWLTLWLIISAPIVLPVGAWMFRVGVWVHGFWSSAPTSHAIIQGAHQSALPSLQQNATGLGLGQVPGNPVVCPDVATFQTTHECANLAGYFTIKTNGQSGSSLCMSASGSITKLPNRDVFLARQMVTVRYLLVKESDWYKENPVDKRCPVDRYPPGMRAY